MLLKSRHLTSAAVAAALFAPLAACASVPGGSPAVVADSAVQRLPDGVIVTPRTGEARAVRLQVFGPRTIRVTASPDDSFEAPASLMVTAEPLTEGFEVETPGDVVLVRAAEVTGARELIDISGETIGDGITLPLGGLRLQDMAKNSPAGAAASGRRYPLSAKFPAIGRSRAATSHSASVGSRLPAQRA